MAARKITLELTTAEADALLAMVTSAVAGDLYELMNRDGRAAAAGLRAERKLRAALDAMDAGS